MEKLKFFFKFPYLTIFLSAISDNIKSGKKNKDKYRKIEYKFSSPSLDIGGK